MSAYGDQWVHRNDSLNPNGYIRLGMQWHPKMLQRVELTGTAINPYNTRIDAPDPGPAGAQPHGIISVAEADYWFGGMIATGVAPQPMGQGGAPGPFDAVVGKWLRRFRYYGHFIETSIQTLHWKNE